jgi:hypothetical protein
MKIAIVIVHGMGSQRKGFSHHMQRGIASFYQKMGEIKAWEDLYFQEMLWADMLVKPQANLFQRLKKDNRLYYNRLRQFIVDYLGDVVAYQPINDRQHSDALSYRRQIQARFKEACDSFKTMPGFDEEKTPLVIIGHSLGTVLLFDYIWQQQMKSEGSPFERAETLAGLITLGSPLALWTLRYPDFGKPVQFPGKALPDSMVKRAKWLNIYGQNDVIAYPLKSINETWDKTVTEDKAIRVGGIMRSWNPLSHTGYWKNKTLHHLCGSFLASLTEK